MDWETLANALNLSRDRLQAITRVLGVVGLVLAVSYIGASFLSAYLMSGMMTKALAAYNRKSNVKVAAASLSFGATENYRDIEKAITDRNLFNSTGEFPDESSMEAKTGEKKASAFDINAPCVKPSINVELLGTIYLDGGSSVATLQEQGYSESDIYKEGDTIVGQDAIVAKIERNRVILNNNGVKECLELASAAKKGGGDGFPSAPGGTTGGPSTAPAAAGDAPAAPGGDCVLEEKYVQDELGPGFGTIIQKARLVPNTTDNQMNGFKIFAIDQSSLLGKTGLKNGDIITQVNDVNLKQPEQGFALYQAFQDEREVRIHILRNNAPMTITCRIK